MREHIKETKEKYKKDFYDVIDFLDKCKGMCKNLEDIELEYCLNEEEIEDWDKISNNISRLLDKEFKRGMLVALEDISKNVESKMHNELDEDVKKIKSENIDLRRKNEILRSAIKIIKEI